MSEVGVESSPTQSPRPELREIFEKDWQDPNVVLAGLGIVAKLGRDLGLEPGVEKGAFDEKGVFKSSWGDIYDPQDKKIGSYQRRDWQGPGTAMRTPGQPLPQKKWTEVFLDVTREGDTGSSHIEVGVWLDKSGRPSTINWEEHRPGQPVRSWTARRDFNGAGQLVRVSKIDSEKGLGGEDVNRSQEEEYRPGGTLLSSQEKHYKVTDGNHVIRISEAGVRFDNGGMPTRRWERRFDPQTGEEIVAGSSEADQKPVVSQQPSAGPTSTLVSPPAPEKPARQGGIRGLINRLAGR